MSKLFTVLMPDIGEGVVEGEVIQWLKKIGDTLAQDEPVVVVMTDKATVELPVPYPGKLVKQYYQPGENAIKGKPLYDIERSDIAVESKAVAPEMKPVPPTTFVAAEPPPPRRASETRTLATPPIRKLAKELDVDLHAVSGSGKDGRVTAEDVKKHLGSRTTDQAAVAIPQLEGDEVRPLQGIRRLTARHVAASKATIPHFSYCDVADVTSLIQFRTNIEKEAQKIGVHITFTPLFIRALSLALKMYPEFNSSYDATRDALVVHQKQQIGIAMKTPLGLIVPVLKGVEQMSFQDTMKNYHLLRQQAVEGKLKPEDMREGTITLSNFGTEGGRWATPVINAPEVAILATARIRPEPVAKVHDIVIRQILNCSWSFDHRVIDGDMAAAFSNAFIKLLENPLRMLS